MSAPASALTRSAKPSRCGLQLLRVASLFLPSAVAWRVVDATGDHGPLDRAITLVLAPLSCLLFVSFAKRLVDAIVLRRRNGPGDASVLDRVDVLTASGAALSWLGAGAILLSTWLGWASLSVVGVLGLGVFHFVAAWALWMIGGEDPWRRTSLTRRFATERAVEGGPVIENLHFAGPRIPVGFRLFARGRIGPRWATSRYVLEGNDDESEVRLETDVGPAIRGEHDAEPLEVWLQDVLGLCHSMPVRAGEASILVHPKARAVRGATEILRARAEIDEPRPALRMPTEGSLNLRAYQPSDDARRIHWARSVGTGQTLVRTPDEAPRDERPVRLVLDTFLPESDAFTCPAPAEFLDTLVALWLGVARTFLDAGQRVDLVVAGAGRPIVVPIRRAAGLASRADELGARAAWQHEMPLDRILTKQPAVVVSYRHQPLPPGSGETLWVLAREWAWVAFDRKAPAPSLVCLPFPMGSPENGLDRRQRDLSAHWRARNDHGRFTRLCGDVAGVDGARAGVATFLATPSLGGAMHVEKLS